MAEASHTRKVLALLEARGEARVGEMAEVLGVDPTTVRRALRRLEQMGLVERTWGGAKLFQAVRYVGEMARGDGENPEAKHRIAVKAASLVKPHMALGISGGTTCTKVARLLRGKPLEVYTNAANIAVELFSYPKTRVFLLPGRLNLFSYEAVGEETVRYVESLPALDLLFVGASAIGPKGFYMRDAPEAAVARALRRKAKEVYVLADSSKWGKEASPGAFFAPLDEVSGWIRED
ncbi:MAG: DeoR/GlpR family DNA-binding transcription regulator [Thermus sp.]